MKFFQFTKPKMQKNDGVSFDVVLLNAISMEAFYEKGKVKITSLSNTIKSLTGSDVVYG